MPLRIGTLILAWLIAMALWGMAHGTSTTERPLDIPVVFRDVPKELVITDQSVAGINIRVLGSRAALRNVSPTKMEYPIDLSGAQPGTAVYEIDDSRIELPRGARIVSRSPSSLEVTLARRGRKSLRVRAELEGEPAPGYTLAGVEVEPSNVWLTGSRREVLRMKDVPTETIDLRGLAASAEREVGLSLPDHIWQEDQEPVTVRIQIEPIPGEPGEPSDRESGQEAS